MNVTEFDLEAHQKKYPLKLGGMPIEEWFALKESTKEIRMLRIHSMLMNRLFSLV